MWTLKHIASGVEKSLADWFISEDFSLSAANKQRRTLSITVTDQFDAVADFTFGADVTAGKIILYRDRTSVGVGGTIVFQGYLMGDARRSTGASDQLQYVFADTWWLLERQRFKQTRRQFAGWTTPSDPTTPATFTDVLLPEVYFGEDASGNRQTNGATIEEVLNWANECYNATKRGATTGRSDAFDVLQVGTIDPAVNIPKSRDSSVHCSEAIVQMLRWSPDCAVQIDDTTTPPTINVLSSASQAVVTLDTSDEQISGITIAPQNDLNTPGIIIYQTRLDTFNGQQFPQRYVDLYPPAITEYTPGVEEAQIELSGANTTTPSASVSATAMSGAVSGTAATRLAWWQNGVDDSLNDPLIDSSTIVVGVATVEASDGSGAINLTNYPRYTNSTIYDWMGVNYVRAKVVADVSYWRYVDSAKKILSKKITKRQVRATLLLTNANTQDYTGQTSGDPGESPLTGIAQAIYTSRQVPQFSGNLRLTVSEVPTNLAIGVRVTVVAPNKTLAQLPLQSIELQPARGLVTLGFAPVAPLEVNARIELARATRFRTMYRMPSGRATGISPGGGSSVDLAAGSATENTTHGVHDSEVNAVNAVTAGGGTPTTYGTVINDAGGAAATGATANYPSQSAVFKVASTGARDLTRAFYRFDLADLEAPELSEVALGSISVDPAYVIFRKFPGCMLVEGVQTTGYWLIPASQFYPD